MCQRAEEATEKHWALRVAELRKWERVRTPFTLKISVPAPLPLASLLSAPPARAGGGAMPVHPGQSPKREACYARAGKRALAAKRKPAPLADTGTIESMQTRFDREDAEVYPKPAQHLLPAAC